MSASEQVITANSATSGISSSSSLTSSSVIQSINNHNNTYHHNHPSSNNNNNNNSHLTNSSSPPTTTSSSPPTSNGGNNNNSNNGQAGNLLENQTEKQTHYSYLKDFRVEQCPNFIQHKCTQHKPYTCFRWHFQNQRRRRPVRRRDGTFNYSPDVYCTKYDETTGLCDEGDDCPFLHRTSGDTERRYHLRYYKTGICVYDTDARGYCVKNGQHCAFAHGVHDLRNPVYDIRELQAMEAGGSGDAPTAVVGDGGTGPTLNGPNPLDKERNALNEDPRWTDHAYVLANYKTELCKRPPRLCRQGYACPQYHNAKDKRRPPKKFKYRSTPCPNVKQGDEWGDPGNCDSGDNCSYCHTRTEQQFHPEIYKSTKCNDVLQTSYCPRGPFCAFAHGDKEMATRHDLINVDTDTDLKNFLPGNLSAGGSISASSISTLTGASGGGNGGSSQPPLLNRTMSCSAGTGAGSGGGTSGGKSIASSFDDRFSTLHGSHHHQNHVLPTHLAGHQSQQPQNRGSAVCAGGASSVLESNNLGAIGTRPRSYSTSTATASSGISLSTSLEQYISRIMSSNRSTTTSATGGMTTATSVAHPYSEQNGDVIRSPSTTIRRSSGIFDASSPNQMTITQSMFPLGQHGGPNLTSRNLMSSSEASEHSFAEQIIGSLVGNVVGEPDLHLDDMNDSFDVLHLGGARAGGGTIPLVNGTDALAIDHHHPNQQTPNRQTPPSSRTDPVNIPGAPRGMTTTCVSALDRASYPTNHHPFNYPSSRARADTLSSIPHNNSQASSYATDGFLTGLSASPPASSVVQAAASILENQRLREELAKSQALITNYKDSMNQAYDVFKRQEEESRRRTAEMEIERDQALGRVSNLQRELEALQNSNLNMRHSSPMQEGDLAMLSPSQLLQLKKQLKMDLDTVDKVLTLKSS